MSDPTPRAPRPGDPFFQSQPSGPAAAPGQRPKKRGRTFFFSLLVVGAVFTAIVIALTVNGRQLTVFAIKHYVIGEALPEMLPADYTVAQKADVQRTLERYFELAGTPAATSEMILTVASRLSAAMADERLTDAEVKELLALTQNLRVPPPRSTP